MTIQDFVKRVGDIGTIIEFKETFEQSENIGKTMITEIMQSPKDLYISLGSKMFSYTELLRPNYKYRKVDTDIWYSF